MNSKNSKIPFKHSFVLNLADKMNLKRGEKYVALSNLNICYTWNNIRRSYKNNKFKISGEALAEEFEFPGRSYSVSDIENYFITKHEPLNNSPPVQIYHLN